MTDAKPYTQQELQALITQCNAAHSAATAATEAWKKWWSSLNEEHQENPFSTDFPKAPDDVYSLCLTAQKECTEAHKTADALLAKIANFTLETIESNCRHAKDAFALAFDLPSLNRMQRAPERMQAALEEARTLL